METASNSGPKPNWEFKLLGPYLLGRVDEPFLAAGGSGEEFWAGIERAIFALGWIWRHESGAYVKFTDNDADAILRHAGNGAIGRTPAYFGRSDLDDAADADDLDSSRIDAGFNCLVAELVAAQNANDPRAIYPDARPLARDNVQADYESDIEQEDRTKKAEDVLARLYPVEQAILATPARAIAGLGVKARHAAYVMSQYWEGPIDQIHWDARTIRLLIESVYDFAGTPMSHGTK